MGGLRFDSLADLPESVRSQVAGKILTKTPVAGTQEPDKPARASKYGNKKQSRTASNSTARRRLGGINT